MATAEEYRRFAEEQRRAADETMLLMVRLKHLSAAEKWEILAEQSERCQPNQLSGISQQTFF